MTKKTKIWLAVGGGILFVGAMNAKAPPKRNRAHAAQEKAPETTAPPPAPAKAPETVPDAGEAPPPQTPPAKAVTAPEPDSGAPPTEKVSFREGWAKLWAGNERPTSTYWDNPEHIDCNERDNATQTLWALAPGHFPFTTNQFEKHRLAKQRESLARQARKQTFIITEGGIDLKARPYNFRRKTLTFSVNKFISCGRSPYAVAVRLPPQNIRLPMSPDEAEQLINDRNNYIGLRHYLEAQIAFQPISGRNIRPDEAEIKGKRTAIRLYIRPTKQVLYDSKTPR